MIEDEMDFSVPLEFNDPRDSTVPSEFEESYIYEDGVSNASASSQATFFFDCSEDQQASNIIQQRFYSQPHANLFYHYFPQTARMVHTLDPSSSSKQWTQCFRRIAY